MELTRSNVSGKFVLSMNSVEAALIGKATAAFSTLEVGPVGDTIPDDEKHLALHISSKVYEQYCQLTD